MLGHEASDTASQRGKRSLSVDDRRSRPPSRTLRSPAGDLDLIKLPFILGAIAIGVVIAMQPGLNADVARRLGSPVTAAFLSIAVAFVLSVAYVVLAREPVSWSALPSLPWYLWLGGAIGFMFVVGTMWLAPVLGAALLFTAIIAGQLIGATLADHFGFFGYRIQAIDPWRLVGIGLVLAGVLVFQRSA